MHLRKPFPFTSVVNNIEVQQYKTRYYYVAILKTNFADIV